MLFREMEQSNNILRSKHFDDFKNVEDKIKGRN